MVVEDWCLPCRYLVHDRDTCFVTLDGVLLSDQLRILKTPPHSPLCNAHAERHVREIRETLDNLILVGEPHLRRALKAIQAHHNIRTKQNEDCGKNQDHFTSPEAKQSKHQTIVCNGLHFRDSI